MNRHITTFWRILGLGFVPFPRSLGRLVGTVLVIVFLALPSVTQAAHQQHAYNTSQESSLFSSSLRGIKQMDMGQMFGCAVLENGEVYCWGENYFGQLGIGHSGAFRTVPSLVRGLPERAIMVSAGGYHFYGGSHACALLASGQVMCWGANYDGQLGNNTGGRSSTPVRVERLGGSAVSVSAGGVHTCALLEDGRVQCWGDNSAFQLGAPVGQSSYAPVTVPLHGQAIALSAGGAHTCAVLKGGDVWCWGDNRFGQLGDGTKLERTEPVRVQNLNGPAVDVAVGHVHSCALLHNGQVQCWGGNYYGQIGDGTNETRYAPTRVRNLPRGIIDVAAGGWRTCALTAGGEAFCWGKNGGGLGNGSMAPSSLPVSVMRPYGVLFTQMSVGYGVTCGISQDKTAFCWGTNFKGQLGTGWPLEHDIPLPVSDIPDTVRNMDTSPSHACAVLQNGETWCWGLYVDVGESAGIVHYAPARMNVPSAVEVATTSRDTCIVTSAGDVYCWGFGYDESPQKIGGLSGPVTHIDGGESTSSPPMMCALTEDNAVQCWAPDSSTSPMTVTLPMTVTAISVGGKHACAVGTQGDVYCWGNNEQGQLGTGQREFGDFPPQKVTLPGPARSVAAGLWHTCASLNDGAVYCWGRNSFGQLGNGQTGEGSPSPTRVSGLTEEVARVTAGGNMTCAITQGGATYCWGAFGEYEARGTVQATPRIVPGLGAHTADVEPDLSHVCALIAVEGGKRAVCWGSNEEGQLGRWAEYTRALYPVPVVSRSPLSLFASTHRVRPGSTITLFGWGASPGADVRIQVNERQLAPFLKASEKGFFIGFLDTRIMSPEEGGYYIRAVDGPRQATIALVLDDNAPLVPAEGGGATLFLPAGIARPSYQTYMPWAGYWRK